MAIIINFEHQEYRSVYSKKLNGFFSIKNIGVYIMEI